MSVASPGPTVDEPVMMEAATEECPTLSPAEVVDTDTAPPTVVIAAPATKQSSHDYHEHEELDFEEEFDSELTKQKSKPDSVDNDEEGELSTIEDDLKDETDKSEIDDNKNDENDNALKEKQEDLEEGEILSDDEPESNTKGVPKLQFI